MKLVNCTETNGLLKSIERGTFGFKKTIIMKEPQKVYAKVIVECGQSLTKIRIGVLEKGVWSIEEKIGRKKQSVSVVKDCKSDKVDVIVTIEIAEEVMVMEFITEAVGDTKIEKRILDKIRYCKKDIINKWKGKPFRLMSENGRTKRKIIECELDIGKTYLIKAWVKEITNCGKMWLDCGHNQSEQKEQLVQAFKYIGKLPVLAVKGSIFNYIVDVKSIVIADSNTIEIEDFLKKEYWR